MDQPTVSWYRWDDMPKEQVSDVLDRRLITGDRVMLSHVYLKQGAVVPRHSHENEQITYILEGALEHRDNMGNGSVIRPGDVQRMTAGSGVSHSEFNSSRDQIVHLLQIWIMPDARNLPPSYEQKFFTAEDRSGKLRLIASPDGSAGSVTIHQDARVYAALLNDGQLIEHTLPPNRYAWIQVARGTLTVNDLELKAGDGAAVNAEQKLEIGAGENAELLLFDLA